MNKDIYAVYDVVGETIVGSLIMENTDAPAIRAFHDALKMPQSVLSQHPADFNLISLGNINLERGIITETAIPHVVVATGASWLETTKAQAYTTEALK